MSRWQIYQTRWHAYPDPDTFCPEQVAVVSCLAARHVSNLLHTEILQFGERGCQVASISLMGWVISRTTSRNAESNYLIICSRFAGLCWLAAAAAAWLGWNQLCFRSIRRLRSGPNLASIKPRRTNNRRMSLASLIAKQIKKGARIPGRQQVGEKDLANSRPWLTLINICTVTRREFFRPAYWKANKKFQSNQKLIVLLSRSRKRQMSSSHSLHREKNAAKRELNSDIYGGNLL